MEEKKFPAEKAKNFTNFTSSAAGASLSADDLAGLRILSRGGAEEIIEKKSRFIGTCRPVRSEEEALGFIGEMRQSYRDARHHCFAYIVGGRQPILRCSDDGEPSQTAGRPILDVLVREDIHEAAIVVTRYFGGVLLGTGGLVRAYQKAASLAVVASEIVTAQKGVILTVTAGYAAFGRLQAAFSQPPFSLLDTQYGEGVLMRLLVPASECPHAFSLIADLTASMAQTSASDPLLYAIRPDGEILFL